MHLQSAALPKRPLALFTGYLFVASICLAGDARSWRLRSGRHVEAEVLAVDGLRATLGTDGVPKWIVPLADFTSADAEFALAWRKASARRPLVDPHLLAFWPPHAVADPIEVRATGEVAGQFRYE